MTSIVVKITSPEEAALSQPRSIARRCLNCTGYKCEKITTEPNAIKVMHDTYITTDCKDFSPPISIVINDQGEIERLKRFRKPLKNGEREERRT